MQLADDGRPEPSAQTQATDPQKVIVDGPALRSARQSQGITLRSVAKRAGVSHGHLSKVEQGQYGRPVTPYILTVYERALGFRIADAMVSGKLEVSDERRGRLGWQPGQLTDFQRQSWRAQVASVGAGGAAGAPDRRLLDTAGRLETALDPDDVETMRALATITAAVESAGQTGGTVAHALLSWAIRLPTERVKGDPAELEIMVARLARVAGATAYRVGRHESARALWLLGLHAAAQADHADLRALILSDIAEQSATVGYPDDALVVLRQADGDERVSEETRARLKAVRALIESAEDRS